MAIKKIEIGDIFEVNFSNGNKGFFQYMMDDSSMMSSNIIRIFDIELEKDNVIDFEILVKKPIKFYTHCMIKGGIKLNLWNMITNIKIEENLFIPNFKETYDHKVKKSFKWYVWEPNKEYINIGELTPEYKSYQQGGVFHPIDVKEWMETGENGFYLPE